MYKRQALNILTRAHCEDMRRLATGQRAEVQNGARQNIPSFTIYELCKIVCALLSEECAESYNDGVWSFLVYITLENSRTARKSAAKTIQCGQCIIIIIIIRFVKRQNVKRLSL